MFYMRGETAVALYLVVYCRLCERGNSCSPVLGSVPSFSWRNQSKPRICAFFKIVAHLWLVC